MTVEPEAEFQQCIIDVEDTLRRAIRAFAEWYAKEWQITAEQWKRDYADPLPGGPEWFAGYNAGVEAITGAADSFLGDYLP